MKKKFIVAAVLSVIACLLISVGSYACLCSATLINTMTETYHNGTLISVTYSLGGNFNPYYHYYESGTIRPNYSHNGNIPKVNTLEGQYYGELDPTNTTGTVYRYKDYFGIYNGYLTCIPGTTQNNPDISE
jgi:hypothetical protein